MNRFKNFLLNKGVYLIAIGCVAVVCLSGLYIANVMDKDEEPKDNSVISQTSDAEDVIALPTVKKSPTTGTSGTATQPATSPGTATNSVATTAPKTTAKATPAPANNIKLDLPIKGKILVDYAMDKLIYNKTLDEWRTHSGIDIEATVGAEVKAAGDGKVVDVKKDPRLGYLIIIEHTGSVKTIYANLKEETNVNIGVSVKKGDLIGWVGKTAPFEFAEDNHLHFEVVLNDNCVSVWNYATKE